MKVSAVSLAVGINALSVALAGGPPHLEQQWTLEGFSSPEGTVIGPDGTLFISNVGGEGSAKDGEGWISKISTDGQLIKARWVEGLDAPKGMAIHEGTLYVSDIDRVRSFDLASGEAGPVIPVDGARFLNDMVVFEDLVLVSDSAGAAIHVITEDQATLWLHDEDRLGGINGMLADGDRLLITTMSAGSLYEFTRANGLSQIATGMENADGIAMVEHGYIVSSWPGEIHFVTEGGYVDTIIDTQGDEIYQNDLTLIGDMLIIPNWQPGTVTGWHVGRH